MIRRINYNPLSLVKILSACLLVLLSFLTVPVYGVSVVPGESKSISCVADIRGWSEGQGPKSTPVSITGGPVLADVDRDYDEEIEVIACGYDEDENESIVCLWSQYGEMLSGWPVELDGVEVEYSPSVADLDGDGGLEIIVTASKISPETGGWIYAWHYDGSIVDGYPVESEDAPGAPYVGDTKDGFEDEVVVKTQEFRVALADVDYDGKKDIVYVGPDGIILEDGSETEIASESFTFNSVSNPVAGDIDADGNVEIFFTGNDGSSNYLYGYRYDTSSETFSALSGFPADSSTVENTDGDYLSLADIDGDDVPEVLSGSINKKVAVWDTDGNMVLDIDIDYEDDITIHQILVADIDEDSDQELIATSSMGILYVWDNNGSLLDGYPDVLSEGNSLSFTGALFDQEGDGHTEILLGTSANEMFLLDFSDTYNVETIQWGMYGFNNRSTGNWRADYNTDEWSVFDNEPAGAEVNCVYDWNRGSRVVELDGAGLNNCYAFMSEDGSYLNTTNTQLQWSMRYSLDFSIYVSVDTLEGRRYLCYTPTEGDMLTEVDDSGLYIHHGLGGDVNDGVWRTFSRSLVEDLHDAYPDNEIVDINAFYIQGSGRVDDVMFLEGEPCAELNNYALDAEVSVSSGDSTKDNINDGDPDSLWVSDAEDNPWVEYTWDEALGAVNKITIENVSGASGVTIFINGVEYEYFEIDGYSVEIVFDSVEDVSSIRIEFDTGGGSVSAGEIGVYYDPNYEDDEIPGEEYTIDDYIQIQDGYFWDPQMNDDSGGYWVPHGFAYQTWVEDLGQWQSYADICSDLDMMADAGANALRVDFVWKHIEEEDDVFSWDNYDMLLEEAQARGFKVFAIIGYQWPPEWFPDEWYTMHPQCEAYPDGPWQSDILSYENDDVHAEFAEYLQAVTARYSVGGAREDLSDTVAGWILGNEYGYLGLWSIEYDGYDDACQEAFRVWLEDRYSGDINALNDKWGSDNIAVPGYLPGHPYSDFSEVDMPIPFGYSGDTAGQYLARDKASWYDLTQWREESIAEFIAFLASAVRDVDSAHLITYAAVGMQWGEEDWRYHTEDAAKIVQACSDAGAPLDFWSINNYPWGLENDELMTGKWGIEGAKHDTGLPVMVTETGFTSTETMYTGVDEDRQALLVRNAVWEALESGAAGVCVFHWNDRDHPGLTERELGFGVVDEDRNPKPAYYSIQEAFQKMDEISINELLPQFIDPAPDIAFLWDDSTDSIINRYKDEMHQLFGVLERLGFNPTFINNEEMVLGDYLNYDVLVLPRNQKMFSDILNLLSTIALDGVKIHVDADLPGIMDEYSIARNTDADWLFIMEDLFGIDTTLSNLSIDIDLEDADYSYGYYETSSFSLDFREKTLYSSVFGDITTDMWKYRDEIVAGSGTVVAQFDDEYGSPAIIMKDYTGGVEYDTAVSLFSLGDNENDSWTWDERYDWMSHIYTDSTYGFGLTPELEVTGSSLVLVDYRTTADESTVLLSFKNYSPDTKETVQVTAGFLIGKDVEDLINDEIIEESCDGTIEHELEADGHSLLIAYEPDAGEDAVEGEGEDGEEEDAGEGEEDVGEEEDVSEDAGESEDKSESSVSSDSSDTTYSVSSGDEDSESVSSSSDASSSSTEADSSDSVDYGSGTVVIFAAGSQDSSSSGDGTVPESELISSGSSSSAKSYSYYRTYIGSGVHSGGGTTSSRQEIYESNLREVSAEIPPTEQFKRRMKEIRDEQPGVIKIIPKSTIKERIEEAISPSEDEIELPLWMDKFFKWINNLTKQLNAKNLSQLAKDGLGKLSRLLM